MTKEQLYALLVPYGQQHLLAFWDRLGPAERESLAQEVQAIDYALVAQLRHRTGAKDEFHSLTERATGPTAVRLGDPGNPFGPQQARRSGEEALRAGQVGVVLVAGGQGTRLGYNHPKGMFPIGPVSGKSLFQIHVEKVLAASRRYRAPIPLCLMTSPATHDETLEFFARNGRFGLPEEDFMVFCQGTMPAVDMATWRILLSEPGHVALSPDGHGGMLAALARSGCLAELRRRGIRQVFYFQVDNALVDVCGPEFLGYHLLSGAEFTTQVVAKRTPVDRVGNLVQVDGRLRMIEYIDLPLEAASRRHPDGSLVLWAGSIAVHCLDTAFLERMAQKADALPFHLAQKRVPFVDESGRRVEPQSPNAIKFERFIFDLLPFAASALAVEVDRHQHFAPLKNAPGESHDSPDWVKARIADVHAGWLREAGVDVAEGTPVEISPLLALDAEELAQKVPTGLRINSPTYFC